MSTAVNSERVAGRFGAYGGRYVPETLVAALEELEHAYAEAQADPAFHARLDDLLHNYAGRPTPLYHAARLTEHGCRASIASRTFAGFNPPATTIRRCGAASIKPCRAACQS